MATLQNFPMKNQLTDAAGPLDADGINDNPRFNCVDEALAAAVQYLTGKTVYGEELKDAEYGDKYQGGTALRNYVDQATDRARKVYGVSAEPFNSTSTVALIHQARAWLRQGFPVIATIPSQWGTAHSESELAKPNFSTHVVCFYTEDGTHMGAMNPWGGFLQANWDSWWAARLCYGQVWKIYKEEADMKPLTLDDVKAYFKAEKDYWRCNNGNPLWGGFLTFYQNNDGLARLGLPITYPLNVFPNDKNADKAVVQVQMFERGAVASDPKRILDNPPGVTGDHYFAHIETGFAFDQLKAKMPPTNPPLSDQQKADLAVMAALRVAVKGN